MLTTAEGVMTQTDRLNGDGLQEVFATNLFGHFILVRLCTKIRLRVWLVWLGTGTVGAEGWVLPYSC